MEQYQLQEQSTHQGPSASQPLKVGSRSTSSTSGSAAVDSAAGPGRGGTLLKHMLSKLAGLTPPQSPRAAAAAARVPGPSLDSAVEESLYGRNPGRPTGGPPTPGMQPGTCGQTGGEAPRGAVSSEITPSTELAAPAALYLLGGPAEGLEEADGGTSMVNDNILFR